MAGGTLFVSRKTTIFSWLKSAFDAAGIRDVTVSSLSKDDLAFQLNELCPHDIFMDSTFYSGVTPYMIGELLIKFPRSRIHIVNFGDFPDSMAVRFIFHGTKSYLDFRDGPDEFRRGLEMIYSGDDYYSAGVDRQINESDEILKLTRQVTGREWQVLFLVCNGFCEDKVAECLAMCKNKMTCMNHTYGDTK